MSRGPLNLYDAVSLHLPRSLPLENGQYVSLPPWAIKRAAPEGTKPLDYPHGVFEIFSNEPIYRRRNSVGMDESHIAQTDTIVALVDTLDYLVSEPDIAIVTSVGGTVSGVPHTFTASVDYKVVMPGTISFTGTGTMPDVGTNIVVSYTHKMFSRVYGHQSRPVVRCTLKVKDGTFGGRNYPKEALAQVLGEALDQFLSANEGHVLSSPPSTLPVPMDMQGMAGQVLHSRVGYSDESLGLATWVVEFQLRRHMVFSTPLVQRILTADVEPGDVSQ